MKSLDFWIPRFPGFRPTIKEFSFFSALENMIQLGLTLAFQCIWVPLGEHSFNFAILMSHGTVTTFICRFYFWVIFLTKQIVCDVFMLFNTSLQSKYLLTWSRQKMVSTRLNVIFIHQSVDLNHPFFQNLNNNLLFRYIRLYSKLFFLKKAFQTPKWAFWKR